MQSTVTKEITSIDVLHINEIYQLKDIYEKETVKGTQIVGEVLLKSNPEDDTKLIYMPAALVKNFNKQQIQDWQKRLQNNAKAFLKYLGKKPTTFGRNYKFDAEWVNIKAKSKHIIHNISTHINAICFHECNSVYLFFSE